MPGDSWNGLQVSINRCAALGKPIIIGETGIHANAVGGLSQRSALFDLKFAAQFAAGVQGELLWNWAAYPNPSFDYIISTNDPVRALLGKY